MEGRQTEWISVSPCDDVPNPKRTDKYQSVRTRDNCNSSGHRIY